ncbi:hypothetical protein L6R52_27830 [Myxococcota bacterium]|nr:hypothetical protein [Myxococcota bacterium]
MRAITARVAWAGSGFDPLVRPFIAVLVGLASSAPLVARAAEWEVALTNRLFSERMAEDLFSAQIRPRGVTVETSTRTAYQAHLLARAAFRPVPRVGLELGIDTGLVELGADGALADGRPLADRAKETWFLGETYTSVELGASGEILVRAGKLRTRIARGAIFDSYALGVDADVDLGLSDGESPWRFALRALLPDATFTGAGKSSPLFEAEAAWAEHGSELRLVGALFVDGDDGLAPVLADAHFRGRLHQAARAVEAAGPGSLAARRLQAFARRASLGYDAGLIAFDATTSGVAGWTGALGKLVAAPVTMRGTLLLGFGAIDARITPTAATTGAITQLVDTYVTRPQLRELVRAQILAPGPEQITLSSLFAELSADVALSPTWSVDAFGLYASGDDGFALERDDGARRDTYRAFVSLAPLMSQTLIFFGGGVASALASPVASSIAPDGAGVVAGGAGLELDVSGIVRARASAAAFASMVESVGTRSRSLGTELDLTIDADAADFLVVSAMGGVLFPGQYFGDLPVGYQLIVQATLIAAQL